MKLNKSKPLSAIFLFLLSLVLTSTTLKAQNNSALFISLDSLQQIISQPNSEILIINFWASYCGPCLEEMPDLEKIAKKYKENGVALLFINLDGPKFVKRMPSFLEKHSIVSTNLILKNNNPNIYMPAIYPRWQGSIPATIILCPGKKKKSFYEGQLYFSELKSIVKKLID